MQENDHITFSNILCFQFLIIFFLVGGREEGRTAMKTAVKVKGNKIIGGK